MPVAADRFVDDRARRDGARAVAEPTVTSTETTMTDAPTLDWRRSTCPTSGCPTARRDSRPSIYAARLEAPPRAGGRARATTGSSSTPTASTAPNLSCLTGFDPRFEEAILVVGADGDPVDPRRQRVLRAWPAPLRCRCDGILFQDLSLPSQPRDRSRPLAEILGGEGIGPGRAGRRHRLEDVRAAGPDRRPGLPRRRAARLAGATGPVENADDLLIDPADGLRVINEVDQLAAFECAACQTSTACAAAPAGSPPRSDASARPSGSSTGTATPLSCHLMLTAGPRATLGLLSPGDRPIERGDRFTTAFGIWGALTAGPGSSSRTPPSCRTGSATTSSGSSGRTSSAIAEWYGALRVGQTGGALQAIIDRHLGDPFFGIFLNPGHQIHLDEWVNSPIWPGSTIELRSGMAFQVDVIPATGTDYFTTNIEDGIALADAALRAASRPAIRPPGRGSQARRAFMADALGIELHPDVLPFSNIPAYLPPFLLRPDRAMTLVS